jgi:hypothetical protein
MAMPDLEQGKAKEEVVATPLAAATTTTLTTTIASVESSRPPAANIPSVAVRADVLELRGGFCQSLKGGRGRARRDHLLIRGEHGRQRVGVLHDGPLVRGLSSQGMLCVSLGVHIHPPMPWRSEN